MFKVTEEPLYTDDLVERLRANAYGAIVTFVGIVRGTSRGRPDEPVIAVQYDAYREMAERKLRQIGEEVRQQWPLVDVAIHHRIGRLALGETSVVIAVASPHRAEGFAACSWALERLKRTVPIWKKEIFADGESWVEGEALSGKAL